ncbi:MAG: M1 family aminopeptidase [Chitinophagaceae bacterium]
MKKTGCFFLLAVLAGNVFGQTLNNNNQPAHYQVKKPAVDIKHILLNLRFDWQKNQAFGTAAISFSPLGSSRLVSLDAAMLSIYSIKLENGAALLFKYNKEETNNNLTITLDRLYSPAETITVIIDYRTNWINATDPGNIWGSTGKGIRFFKPSPTEPNRRRQIWSMGEGEGNRYWFPSVDAPGDLRTTEFIATIDTPFVIISNGLLIDKKINNDGTHTFHYKSSLPYPNHKTAFVAGEYVDITGKASETTLHNFAYPNEKEATIATIDRLPDMIKYFSSVTGTPYPFPVYSQVFVQELPWGYGSSAVSVQTENMVDDFITHADFLYLWDMLEGESLANQWFGNYLSTRDWRHYWLDKAFSRYFSCLYDEYKNGKDEFLLYQLTFDQGIYFNDWNTGIRHSLVTDRFGDVTAFINENYPNSRGSLVLHMLRKQLGEENWRKAIRQYVHSNAGKTVTTDDLLKAVETATGKKMGWFFEQWVYKMGHPAFEVTKSYDSVKKQLKLIAKQIQKIDSGSIYPQVQFFKGKMQIEIDERMEEIFINPKFENIFYFPCKQAPRLVNFDFESSWIKEIKLEKSTDELVYQLLNDKDILGKREALNKLAVIAKTENTSQSAKEKIYEGFRKIISGSDYWRFRYSAILALQGALPTVAGDHPLLPDSATTSLLLRTIKNDSAWIRAGAIGFLGQTKNDKYADLYIDFLGDKSERVINAAAIALGQSKSSKAFDALVKLKDKPSWKNQSLISSLNGLKDLGDKRAVDYVLPYINASQLPHWTLATSRWDHRLAAAETLVALGAAEKAYPLVLNDFKKAVEENNVNDIFYNLLQIVLLSQPGGQEAFDQLKIKYKDDAAAMAAVANLETQFKESIKPK